MMMHKMSARISKPLGLALLIALLPPVVVHAEAPGLRADCAEYPDRLRRRPGDPPREAHRCDEAGLAPAVWGELPYFTAVPDRWRIVNAIGYRERLWDPYNGNNVLKGDRPAFGDDWFFALNLISDSTFEDRSLPTPVAVANTPQPGVLDVLGDPGQTLFTRTYCWKPCSTKAKPYSNRRIMNCDSCRC